MKSPILYEFILSFMVVFPNILTMLYPCFFLFSSTWQQLKLVYRFWCLLSSQLTYKSADSWPRVSTDKHTFVVGLVLIPGIRQVLDPGYHNNSLWLLIQQDYVSEHRLASLAPSSTKALLKWGDIFLRQTLPICEQIVLYLKTTIFTFLIDHPTFIWCLLCAWTQP